MTIDEEPARALMHLGKRPSWDCTACSQPWPCATAKTTLVTEFQEFPSVLAIYMASQLHEAFVDLTAHGPVPPADLYDRFLAWITIN